MFLRRDDLHLRPVANSPIVFGEHGYDVAFGSAEPEAADVTLESTDEYAHPAPRELFAKDDAVRPNARANMIVR